MMTKVILVDEQDQVVGEAEKLLAHQQGLLHRAFSVFIYRFQQGQCEVLLQQRHPHKYHSGNLWTNSCCSHPAPGEEILDAAKRRLQEELGITTELQEIGSFQYRAEVDHGLIENEIDHVLLGEMSAESIKFNTEEIASIAWVELNALRQQLATRPEHYTVWLPQALEIFCSVNHIKQIAKL